MMNNFYKVGDIVETLDDDISGEIIKVEGEHITLKSEDLFEMTYHYTEVIKKPEKDLHIQEEEINKVWLQEISNFKISHNSSKTNKKMSFVELDLHIHELIDDARKLSNFEILNIQLNRAKQQLEWAIQKRIPKVIFIHGKGQGVLKTELYALLNRFENIEYYDANYHTYGTGATEVRIY